jgi:hypothetical protein
MTETGDSEGGPVCETSEESLTESEEPDDEHLEDLPVGSGCVEVWEHLSENREDDDE